MKILSILLGLAIFFSACTTETPIRNFEECVNAGYPVMESYPRQCSDGENTWTEVIKETWENDGIILMQSEQDGSYGCFGCDDEICVDPAPEMKPVNETEDRYCNYDFEVVASTPEVCTKEYRPVCGEIQVQCITTPCDPIKTTFGNRCEAENAGAENIVEGTCEEVIEDSCSELNNADECSANPDCENVWGGPSVCDGETCSDDEEWLGCKETTNPKGACLSFDGNWIEETKECEGMPKEMCENLGGTYNECASACRNTDSEFCTLQCVMVCEFS